VYILVCSEEHVMAKSRNGLTVLVSSEGWNQSHLDALGQLGRLLHHPDHPECAVLACKTTPNKVQRALAELEPGDYEHRIVRRGNDPAIPAELHHLLVY
jgi:hypothetical protein